MIDFKKAVSEFNEYVSLFDMNDISTKNKVKHTFHVMNDCEALANNLSLCESDIELAKLIGLLHDIGRFDEIRFLGEMDAGRFNHAVHGVNLLFEDNYIRKYIDTNKFDDIISFAILNHNKFEIEKVSDERMLLFAKIIRDADKLDNFRVKSFEDKLSMSPKLIDNVLEFDVISDDVLKSFYSKSTILSSTRKTALDIWISYIAFIFDFNYKYCVEVIRNNNYINIIIDRINYKNVTTKNTMEELRCFVLQYIDDFISNN